MPTALGLVQVFMKLGRNGRLFYRLCTLDKQLTAFSMHIKGSIVEYPFSNMQHISFGSARPACIAIW